MNGSTSLARGWTTHLAFMWDGRVLQYSFADGMPVHNERRDVSLIFSGEEYAEPGVAQRLKERGHSFEVDGPAYWSISTKTTNLSGWAERPLSRPAGRSGARYGHAFQRPVWNAPALLLRVG